MALTKLDESYVYLDYAATAPLCEEAACAMAPYMVPGRANLIANANANSTHSAGRAAFMVMEDARRSIARVLGARRAQEIIFTSGATESDNAALIGMAHAAAECRRPQMGSQAPHVVITKIEHEAVRWPAKRLRAQGFEVTAVRPDRNGFVSCEAIEQALTPNTVLVSVQMANSEVGSIQPIADITKLAHEAGVLMHTDATQALGKIPVNLEALGVDAASFSGHKIGAPKGVGLLYLKARTPFDPYLLGGGQEAGLRSGTQNIMGIVGIAAAVGAVCDMVESERERLSGLRDRLYTALTELKQVNATVPGAVGSADYLPNIVHVLVHGFESETLIICLDAEGIGVSGGSACSSGSLEPSRVLTAMGVPRNDAQGALRISMGRYTTEEDIDRFIEALEKVLA